MDDVVLPVGNLAVTLDFLSLIVVIIDVQSCVVGKVPEGHFIEALKEHVVCSGLARSTALGLCELPEICLLDWFWLPVHLLD